VRSRPNDRTQRAAARLIAVAPDITRAVELLREELDAIGFPRRGGDSGKVRGGTLTIAVKHNDNGEEETDHVPCTTVEKTVIDGWHRAGLREDLRDLITAVEDQVTALVRLTRHILGEPLPNAEGEALCADKQRGRDGVIEWGDATCTELPLASHGLCFRCYQRERRWRADRGLDFRGEAAS
jgi:hypothetical protein